jgi:hypothetical protein
LQPLLADRPAAEVLGPKSSVAQRGKRKTLRRRGKYWFGEGSADVWNYFVRRGQEIKIPVNHWKQAICYKCGHTRFEVDLQYAEAPNDPEAEPEFACRRCVRCDEWFDILDPEGLGDLGWGHSAVCVCAGEEFEVVGVTAPGGNPDSAWWFYLGLRCVRCGCLGCYAMWLERYNDWRELLALM